MKISLNFSELTSKLSFANVIINDKSVDERMRNVIFSVTPDSVMIVGYNAFTFVRSTFENAECDLGDAESWMFQVKSSELNKVISAYSNLFRTKVSGVEFLKEDVRIKMIVHEVAKEEGNTRLDRDGEFLFECAPILDNIKKEIMLPFPEDVDSVPSGDILLYLDSLFPLLSGDSASSMGSRINFADDWIFVINSSMSAFMVNKLPDAFKSLCLSYSSSNFLKKLSESSDGQIGVARNERYLCVQKDNMETFMQYQKVKVKYDMYVNKRSKDKGIVLDRLYLKDVLKRMGTMDATGTLKVLNEEELEVSNSNFIQSLPINQQRDAMGIGFNISIPTFEKAILGKDDVFSGDVFIHFVSTARGYLVFLSDKSGAWFTNTQVTGV